MACGVEDVAFVEGRGKIGVIDYVEELGAELDVEGIGNSLDVVVFENGEIQLRQPRPDQDIPAQIALQIGTINLTGRQRGAVRKINARIRKRCRYRGWHARKNKAIVVYINGPGRIFLKIRVD